MQRGLFPLSGIAASGYWVCLAGCIQYSLPTMLGGGRVFQNYHDLEAQGYSSSPYGSLAL